MMRLLTDALLSAGIPRPQLPTHFRHIVELGCRNGQLLAHVAEHLATGNAVAERPLPGYGGMRQGSYALRALPASASCRVMPKLSTSPEKPT